MFGDHFLTVKTPEVSHLFINPEEYYCVKGDMLLLIQNCLDTWVQILKSKLNIVIMSIKYQMLIVLMRKHNMEKFMCMQGKNAW